MRTPRPKPNRLHDELDALLDGRPVELTDELAPLAEAADALRAELAAYQLDPAVADRHLEQVLDGAPVVRLPVRSQPHGWELRRRLAAVVVAAALVLAPATMASAAALPGQAMYPFKRAIEELRIASARWSPSREAVERTQVADERLEEVQRLTELRLFNQLPTALNAFAQAVSAAKAAVVEAQQKGASVGRAQAQLTQVMVEGTQVTELVVKAAVRAAGQQGVVPVSGDTLTAITTAAAKSQKVLDPPEVVPAEATPTPTTTSAEAAQPTQPTQASGGATQTSATTPASSTTEAPTTTEASTTTDTTQAPTTTASAPSESSVTTGSVGGAGGDDPASTDGQSPEEAAPTTTLPGP